MSSERVLTEKLILEKTKVKSIDDVHRLDLWGEGLSDVGVVAKLQNIRVLALTTNSVATLKPFEHCAALEELYLRKNKIQNLRDVTALKGLHRLSVLWLMDNPCSQHPFYRDFVLHCCPGLRQLDSAEVTQDERASAARRLSPRILDDILGRLTPAPPAPVVAAAASPTNANHFHNSNSSPPVLAPPQSSHIVPGGAGATQAGRVAKRDSNATAAPAAVSSPPGPSTLSSGGTSMVEERCASGRTVLFTTVAAQRAMLLSIVSLLSELTVESLELLQREVQERIEKQKKKVTKFSQESP